jgi:hypothetical protein
MPFQNRVDPYGALFRTPARGTLMGNRGGALHNQSQEIVRSYKNRRWIACLLQFKGIKRSVMSPHLLYTELFFLDEAVSFAAGHRPCAECRRERFNAFLNAWNRPLRAPELDAVLHGARIDRQGRKVTFPAPLHSLPNGCFIDLDGSSYLVWDDALCLWTPGGYTKKQHRPNHQTVNVLTPQPTVECFRQGYQPQTHASLQNL